MALGATVLATAVPGLKQKVATFVKNSFEKMGIGGTTDNRFFDDYLRVRDAFVKRGYLDLNSDWHKDALTRNRIRRSQVQDKGNFTKPYQRLRTWIIQVLNHSNPGLGDDYAELFPKFPMATEGGAFNAPMDAAIEIVNTIKPFTYKHDSLGFKTDGSLALETVAASVAPYSGGQMGGVAAPNTIMDHGGVDAMILNGFNRGINQNNRPASPPPAPAESGGGGGLLVAAVVALKLFGIF